MKVGDVTGQTNPLSADSQDEYPRIYPLPKKEVSNNPTSVDEYPQIYPISSLTRDKELLTPIVINNNKGVNVDGAEGFTIPLSQDSEDEYPRIHPILPLPKKEESYIPSSVDEYPQIYPIRQLIKDKNKGVKVEDATGQTNPLSADSQEEYPRIYPIIPLPKAEEPNNPTSVDEYPQIYPIRPLTRDKDLSTQRDINKNGGVKVEDATGHTNPLSAASEDEYPRIYPIMPLSKKEVPNNPTSVDEYPQIYPLKPLTKDKEFSASKMININNGVKVESATGLTIPFTNGSGDEYPRIHPILPLPKKEVPNNPSTSDPPLKNKPQSVGLISIGNDDETPIIIKLPPGLNYNQAPSKTKTYNQEPIMQYENMAQNRETFTNKGVNFQSNYQIPVQINPGQTGTQNQGQLNYSPADTNLGGNQDFRYQQTVNPQYSYEYQNQYPQQVQQNNEYIIQRVPASNYQQSYQNHRYNRPYYSQSQGGFRPQETIYSLGFSDPSGGPFREIGSRIKSVIQNVVRPFLG